MIAIETVVPIAVYSFDKSTGYYTISLLERGGPIVVNKDLDEAKSEFKYVLDLAYAARNLMFFDSVNKFRNIELSRSKPNINNLEYRELTAA